MIKEIEQMTDKQLKKEYLDYEELIDKVDCFGLNDLIYFDHLEAELYKRGFEVETVAKSKIKKAR